MCLKLHGGYDHRLRVKWCSWQLMHKLFNALRCPETSQRC